MVIIPAIHYKYISEADYPKDRFPDCSIFGDGLLFETNKIFHAQLEPDDNRIEIICFRNTRSRQAKLTIISKLAAGVLKVCLCTSDKMSMKKSLAYSL